MFFYIFFVILLLLALFLVWRIAAADFRRRIIPDIYLLPLMVIGLLLNVFYQWPSDMVDAAVGAAMGYVVAVSIGFIFDSRLQKKNPGAPAPIGMGDVKLITVGGLWLGAGASFAVALLVACVAGWIWGYVNKQKYIPFAPFFLMGGILSLIGKMFLL
jgi:prepilin signal peptidase PulO-like enzyme (type II secretory pathway)